MYIVIVVISMPAIFFLTFCLNIIPIKIMWASAVTPLACDVTGPSPLKPVRPKGRRSFRYCPSRRLPIPARL